MAPRNNDVRTIYLESPNQQYSTPYTWEITGLDGVTRQFANEQEYNKALAQENNLANTINNYLDVQIPTTSTNAMLALGTLGGSGYASTLGTAAGTAVRTAVRTAVPAGAGALSTLWPLIPITAAAYGGWKLGTTKADDGYGYGPFSQYFRWKNSQPTESAIASYVPELSSQERQSLNFGRMLASAAPNLYRALYLDNNIDLPILVANGENEDDLGVFIPGGYEDELGSWGNPIPGLPKSEKDYKDIEDFLNKRGHGWEWTSKGTIRIYNKRTGKYHEIDPEDFDPNDFDPNDPNWWDKWGKKTAIGLGIGTALTGFGYGMYRLGKGTGGQQRQDNLTHEDSVTARLSGIPIEEYARQKQQKPSSGTQYSPVPQDTLIILDDGVEVQQDTTSSTNYQPTPGDRGKL